MTPFGAKLRQIRQERGLSLKQMAQQLNVSSAYISALEHGHRGKPNFFMVQRIITLFNVIWDEAEELQRLAELSDPRVTIYTAGLDPKATELANELAKRISMLGETALEHMLATLKKS